MKIFSFALVFCALSFLGHAQPLPPSAASQTEVNAGTIKYKYVSPATLNGWSGSVGGGGWTGNPNQFSVAGGTTNIKSGALVTNLNEYGLLNIVNLANTATAQLSVSGNTLTIQDGLGGNMDVTATSFTGSGVNLTGIPQLGANQAWTGSNYFNVLSALNWYIQNAYATNFVLPNQSNGVLYAQANGTVVVTNSGFGLTNINANGVTFSGTQTNLVGTTHTGGRSETNFVTGNGSTLSNGVFTIMASNNAATSTIKIDLTNTVAATSGNPKASPSIRLQGHGWNTTGGTDSVLGFTINDIPTSASTAVAYLVISNLDSSLDLFRLKTTGGLDLDNGNLGLAAGGVAAGANASSAAQGQISSWSGGTQRGVLNSTGVILQSTAGLKVTSTANSQGTVDIGFFRSAAGEWEADNGTAGTVIGSHFAQQYSYTTNSGSAVSPNMAVGYALLSTNAAFAMLAPTGVDAAQLRVQTSVLMVTNTTAAAVAITTAAAPVKSTGTWYVTNVSAITTTVYPKVVTNMICLPIF